MPRRRTSSSTFFRRCWCSCLRFWRQPPKRLTTSLSTVSGTMLSCTWRAAVLCRPSPICEQGLAVCFKGHHTHRLQMSRGGPGALPALFHQGNMHGQSQKCGLFKIYSKSILCFLYFNFFFFCSMCLWPWTQRQGPQPPLTRCWPWPWSPPSSKLRTTISAISCSRWVFQLWPVCTKQNVFSCSIGIDQQGVYLQTVNSHNENSMRCLSRYFPVHLSMSLLVLNILCFIILTFMVTPPPSLPPQTTANNCSFPDCLIIGLLWV